MRTNEKLVNGTKKRYQTAKFPWGIQTEQREKETAEPLNSCEPGCSTNKPPSENAHSGLKKKKERKKTNAEKMTGIGQTQR